MKKTNNSKKEGKVNVTNIVKAEKIQLNFTEIAEAMLVKNNKNGVNFNANREELKDLLKLEINVVDFVFEVATMYCSKNIKETLKEVGFDKIVFGIFKKTGVINIVGDTSAIKKYVRLNTSFTDNFRKCGDDEDRKIFYSIVKNTAKKVTAGASFICSVNCSFEKKLIGSISEQVNYSSQIYGFEVLEVESVIVPEFEFMKDLIKAEEDDFIPLKAELKNIIGGLRIIIAG